MLQHGDILVEAITTAVTTTIMSFPGKEGIWLLA